MSAWFDNTYHCDILKLIGNLADCSISSTTSATTTEGQHMSEVTLEAIGVMLEAHQARLDDMLKAYQARIEARIDIIFEASQARIDAILEAKFKPVFNQLDNLDRHVSGLSENLTRLKRTVDAVEAFPQPYTRPKTFLEASRRHSVSTHTRQNMGW